MKYARTSFVKVAQCLLLCVSSICARAQEANPPMVAVTDDVSRLSVVLVGGGVGEIRKLIELVRADSYFAAFRATGRGAAGVAQTHGSWDMATENKEEFLSLVRQDLARLWMRDGRSVYAVTVREPAPLQFQLTLALSCRDDDCVPKRVVDPDIQKIVPASVYTQPGFTATRYGREFAEWKKRFVADRKALFVAAEKIHFDGKLDPIEKTDARQRSKENAYRNSIDGGRKGRSLVNLMEDALYSQNSHVSRPGMSVARLIDNNHSKAVGFGGTFTDEGRTVELWYVVFHDIKTMTNGDLRTTASYSVFSPLELPRLNEVKRKSWPAMLFVRDQKGRLMLYSLSAEQFAIIDRMEWKSMQ